MNASQVRAKARRAMRRLEEQYEQEEIEGGELNLVPYLDIVVNITLFLIASISTGILGNLTATAKAIQDPSQISTPAAVKDPGLELVVAITKSGLQILSAGEVPRFEAPAPLPTKYAAYQPEVAAAELQKQQAEIVRLGGYQKLEIVDVQVSSYDWKKLGEEMDKLRKEFPLPEPVHKKDGTLDYGRAKEITLLPDGEVPYQVIVHAMDTVRPYFSDIIFSPGVR